MKRLLYSLLMTGYLSMMHLLLGACNEDIDIENNQVQINGNTATLTFTVGKSDFSSEQINTRSDVPNDTIRQELGDGYMIETVIAPDTSDVLTRTVTPSTTIVKNDVKILAIAYRGSSLYKREVATVQNGKFAIHLPPEETFKLLFYSYNEPNKPAPTEYCSSTGWKPSTNTSESGTESYFAESGASLVVKNNEIARDLMWATATLTVTSTTKLEEINFKHLFCKVELTVSCTDKMTKLLAVIGPQAYSNAKVDISGDPNEDENKKWIGTGGKIDTKIEASSSGGMTQLGGAADLIPDGNENMTLGYEKITIDGQDFKTTTSIDLNTQLARGHRYKITSTVRKNDLVTITFNAEEGGNVSSLGTHYGSTGSKSSTATSNNGYTFDGWYKDGVKLPDSRFTGYTLNGNTITVNFDSGGQGTYTAKFLWNLITAANPECNTAVSEQDMLRLLNTPKAIVYDSSGPAWTTRYSSGTATFWIIKKLYWSASTTTDARVTIQERDGSFDSSKYVPYPACGVYCNTLGTLLEGNKNQNFFTSTTGQSNGYFRRGSLVIEQSAPFTRLWQARTMGFAKLDGTCTHDQHYAWDCSTGFALMPY